MRLIQIYIVYVACMRVYKADTDCHIAYEGSFHIGLIYEAHLRPVCIVCMLLREGWLLLYR